MKYQLKAYTIWEQGPREKQEDSIFPAHGTAQSTDRLFILCDGMGGHDAGEVASQTVCAALSSAIFARNPEAEGSFSDDDFRAGLSEAYDALDARDNGAAKKMGTTLTFLKFHDRGCTIAHMGDSRVYHIRPGKSADDTAILFQTEDHSLVNDLVKIGELTREEAKDSKQKNVITRAMQPCMERRPKADLHHTHDIRPGDWFMLCSDGILEQMEDENLRYIFSEKGGDAAKKVAMLIQVTANNHDNHSAILVQITDVIDPLPVEAPRVAAPVPPAPHTRQPEAFLPEDEEEESTGNQVLKWILCAILVALLAFGGIYAYKYWMHKSQPVKSEPQQELPENQAPRKRYNAATPGQQGNNPTSKPGRGASPAETVPDKVDAASQSGAAEAAATGESASAPAAAAAPSGAQLPPDALNNLPTQESGATPSDEDRKRQMEAAARTLTSTDKPTSTSQDE